MHNPNAAIASVQGLACGDVFSIPLLARALPAVAVISGAATVSAAPRRLARLVGMVVGWLSGAATSGGATIFSGLATIDAGAGFAAISLAAAGVVDVFAEGAGDALLIVPALKLAGAVLEAASVPGSLAATAARCR